MSSTKRLLLIIALTALWSPSFLFIKLAVHDLPPITMAAWRVTLAAVLLSLLLIFKKQPLPTKIGFWAHMSVMAFFSSVFPFCLFSYAEQSIESALAAILNGTTPMFTALMAHYFIPSDRLNLQRVLGISLSIVGLLLLFAPNIQTGLEGSSSGMIAATIAAFCYSVGHIYGKKFVMGQKPFVAPTAQLILSSLFLFPAALWINPPSTLPMPSLSAVFGVIGLAVFGTFLAFIIFYKLLEECGPTAVAMVACFFPVGGMALGFLFLGEAFTLGSLFASALIFLGIMLVNNVISLKLKTADTSLVQS